MWIVLPKKNKRKSRVGPPGAAEVPTEQEQRPCCRLKSVKSGAGTVDAPFAEASAARNGKLLAVQNNCVCDTLNAKFFLIF